MIKFNYSSDGHDVQMVLNTADGAETWVEVTEVFQRFLTACGYVFDERFDMASLLDEEHARLLDEKYSGSFRKPEEFRPDDYQVGV